MALYSESGPTTLSNPPLSETRSDALGRTFFFLLLAITVASAIPRLIIGASQFISYDGYWHLFISRHNNWRMWWFEVQADGHPPIFYLIQYCLSFLGRSNLLYRSASILPGAGATFVIGLIAAKLFQHRAVALLTALSYGFAMSIIDLTIDVRAYPLAIFFCLLAYYFFLGVIRNPDEASGNRPFFLFALFTSLAILNEYFSMLFFASCIALPVLYAVQDRSYRERLIGSLRRRRAGWAVALAVPVLVAYVMYRVQMRFMPGPQGHLREYYWTPHSGITLSDFLFKNLATELRYFFPSSELTQAGLCVLLLLTLPVLVNRLILRRDAGGEHLRGSGALILLMLLLELMFAAASAHYPFGGQLRQQSIIAPFFTLTGFLFLDWTLDAVGRPWQRLSLVVIAALSIGGLFAHSWRHYVITSNETVWTNYRNFRAVFTPKIVYSDFFTTFHYFRGTLDWDWHYENYFQRGGRKVFIYQLTSPTGERVKYIRCRDNWTFDLTSPSFYTTLAEDLRSAHVDSAVLFSLNPAGVDLNAAAANADQEKFRRLARAAGLDYGRSVYDGRQAYIEFRARGFEPLPVLDVGTSVPAGHLGFGWYPEETGGRWMSKRSLIHALGPVNGASELVVSTFWPREILTAGPIRISAEAEGIALKPIEVEAEGLRDLRWVLPKSLWNRKSIDVVLEVDKARQYPTDPRTLGMVVARVALETPQATSRSVAK